MICEVRNEGNEVVLRNPTLGDIIDVFKIWVRQDKELCFTRPVDEEEVPHEQSL